MSKITMSFFTDLHLRGQTPSSRKDDYPKAILNKLGFCLRHASKNDFALFGGDFCHSFKLTSDSIKEKAISLFDEFLDVPMFYTWGQHDLLGKEYKTRKDSTKAFIIRQALRNKEKSISEISIEEDLIVEHKGIKIGLASCPSGVDCIEWAKEKSKNRNPKIDIRIALVHHLLTSDPDNHFLIGIDSFYTGTEDNRSFDVVLCGDLHTGFKPHRNEVGTLFLNPGSLARTAKTVNDMARPIRGVDIIIDINTKKVEYDFWSIECAGTAEEIFKNDSPIIEDFEIVNDNSSKNEVIEFEEVINALESIGASKIDVWDMLEMKAREVGLDDDVLNYILAKRPEA